MFVGQRTSNQSSDSFPKLLTSFFCHYTTSAETLQRPTDFGTCLGTHLAPAVRFADLPTPLRRSWSVSELLSGFFADVSAVTSEVEVVVRIRMFLTDGEIHVFSRSNVGTCACVVHLFHHLKNERRLSPEVPRVLQLGVLVRSVVEGLPVPSPSGLVVKGASHVVFSIKDVRDLVNAFHTAISITGLVLPITS